MDTPREGGIVQRPAEEVKEDETEDRRQDTEDRKQNSGVRSHFGRYSDS
jgi:hypothetical protein